jgi:hypothetical protein
MTYTEYATSTVSEKISLVILEAAERLMGWTLVSGSTYKLSSFTHAVIVSLKESATSLTEGASSSSLSAGQYYHDQTNQVLYLRTTESANPNSVFIALTFRMFFSSPGGLVSLPHDMASGFEVEWLPLVQNTSQFGVELDNQNQLGVAIEGSGSIKLVNDKTFWKSRFDKLVFENQRCFIYSWTRDLPASQAKILFKGRVQSKTYALDSISFSLKDALNTLRSPVELPTMDEVVGARLTQSLQKARQRTLYGYVYGHRPTPIDAVLQGYPLEGTVAVTNGSTTVTGTNSEFLRQLSPDDELYFVSPVGTRSYTVESISSDTSLVLSESYSGLTDTGVGYYIKPRLPKRYINRRFLIAGHALREPTPTISERMNSTSRIRVTSAEDLEVGDDIIVGSESSTIERVYGDTIVLTTALLTPPEAGTEVRRPSVTQVKLGERLLEDTRDYTYNPDTAILTLDELAEFNVAPTVSLSGVITITNSSRNVTGTSTQFTTQLEPGHWIKAEGQFSYFEVLSVTDDSNLVLRTPATYTATNFIRAKRPEYYLEGTTVLSCDVLGKTSDGTTSGTFLKTVPQIIRDLLITSGIEESIDSDSFDDAIAAAPQRVGYVIPKTYESKNAPKLKDVIGELNKSVFGSLVQNSDFNLSMRVLRPKRETGIQVFTESEILRFSVRSISDKIAKTVRLRYAQSEYDPISKDAIFSERLATNKYAEFLSLSTNEFLVETCLVSEKDARIAANRWAFLMGVATHVVSFDTKLQGNLVGVTDRIEIQHEHLFERVGSPQNKKIAAVQSAKKSYSDCRIEIDDLGNAFSRCGIITANDYLNYSDCSDDERFYGSFITDSYGMQSNDPETFGINLIW